MTNPVKQRRSWQTPQVRKIEAGSAEAGPGEKFCDDGTTKCGNGDPIRTS